MTTSTKSPAMIYISVTSLAEVIIGFLCIISPEMVQGIISGLSKDNIVMLGFALVIIGIGSFLFYQFILNKADK